MQRPSITRRFRPEALFRPRSVMLVGGDAALTRAIGANLAAFAGPLEVVAPAGIEGRPAVDLAVLACAPPDVAGALLALGRIKVGAVVCATPAPDLAAAARAAGVRVLGPASFGVIVPALRLNASTSHLTPALGKVALVSQSSALCRAVLDWAGPNGVGFSHVVGTGGNAQTGFSVVLDWLSRDPGTGAILLDIRGIRDRRSFLAAARAAARLRPVVAIRAGGRLADPSGRADAVFDAALRRVGVLRVSGFEDLLGAAEVLTRARPVRSERLAIVTNAVGPAHLAADAAVKLGLPLLELDETAQMVLRMRLPVGPMDPGIVWTGADEPVRVAEAAAMLAGVAEAGGVVAILAPTGPGDAAAVSAIAAGYASLRAPLLVCVLGETTGAGHRHTLAEAGVPVFATPEAAVRAFGHLVQQRRARAAARELPPRRVLQVAPNQVAVAGIIDAVRLAGRTSLSAAEAGAVLAAYGLGRARAPGRARALRVSVADDLLFGPAIGFGLGGEAASLLEDVAYELPPLNVVLARALIGLTRAGRLMVAQYGVGAAETEAVADALVRVSQLVQDHPEIGGLAIDPLLVDAHGCWAGNAWIGLRLLGEGAQFAISAYPEELAEWFDARGERLLIRPIRPEDAEAHAALFRRLSPEDVRYRFFNMLRELPPEQIARMTQVDYDREMAFVAVRETTGETIGVCRLVREPGTDQGEFAVIVESAMKGRGLARRLMERVIEWGRTKGMRAVVGQVLADNAPMLAFMRRLGAEIHRMPEEPEVMEAVIRLDRPET